MKKVHGRGWSKQVYFEFNIIFSMVHVTGSEHEMNTKSVSVSKSRDGVVFLLQVFSWTTVDVCAHIGCRRILPHTHIHTHPLSTDSRSWHQAKNGLAVMGGNQCS